MTPYQLEKPVWNETDFEQMGWHDATIYALAPNPADYELMFDLDYILQWVAPIAPDTYFNFWIAPATLIFRNVSSVDIELSSHSGEITIQDLHRTDEQLTPNGKSSSWLWLIEANEGEIKIRAGGYNQYFRHPSIFSSSQSLSLADRGGLSFGREYRT